jgi:FkbM family methyltransferase
MGVRDELWRAGRRALATLERAAPFAAAKRGAAALLARSSLVVRARLDTGDVLYVDLASRVGRSIFLRGRYDAPLVAFVLGAVREGDAFLDVGANVGYYTALAARRVGPSGLVVAVEPAPLPLSLLGRSVAANGWTNVVLSSLAAGPAPRVLRFRVERDSGLSRVDTEGDLSVASARLDDFVLPWLAGRSLAALKIDVEGFELDALAGMTRLFEEAPPRRVLAEALGPRAAELLEFFRARGYRVLDPATGQPADERELGGSLWNVGFERQI